ncbi:hypothetical protein CLOM_g7054 [Closterium sp. NIES-68]|nr:hypothetical protein CLOM_g7054 [Closterium sp. NIES-68]
MASLCFSSTISQLLPPEVSAYRLRSSPHASHFRLTSPGLLGRFTLRYPSSPLNFNPLCLSPLQASSTRYRPTSCISCSLGDDKASRTGQTGNSGNPDGGHTASNVNPFESAQKAPAFPRPLALTSAAAISAALALSALPALAADVTSFESLPQVESVSFRDASAQEKGVILASSSLTAPSLDRSSELTPSMPTPTSSNSLLSPAYPASSSLAIAVSEAESAPGAPSILDSAVTVTLSGSVSDASKSGPILQLASREAASRGMVNTCTNLLAACVLLVWFQRVGTLPPSTADVLAQVSNRVLIPCFLAVHVASAVSSAPESVLSSLPLIAFAQLLCAASLGHLVRTHAHQSSSSSPSSSPPPFPLSSLFSSSLLPRPPHLSPRPSTALHQLAASIASTLSPLDHPTTEAAADPSLRQQQAEAAVVTPLDAGLTGGLAGRGLMLLLLLAMTVSSEACGDSLAAGQLALLAVGWGPALYILAYNALLWTESRTLESRAPAVGVPAEPVGRLRLGQTLLQPTLCPTASSALPSLELSHRRHAAQPSPSAARWQRRIGRHEQSFDRQRIPDGMAAVAG